MQLAAAQAAAGPWLSGPAAAFHTHYPGTRARSPSSMLLSLRASVCSPWSLPALSASPSLASLLVGLSPASAGPTRQPGSGHRLCGDAGGDVWPQRGIELSLCCAPTGRCMRGLQWACWHKGWLRGCQGGRTCHGAHGGDLGALVARVHLGSPVDVEGGATHAADLQGWPRLYQMHAQHTPGLLRAWAVLVPAPRLPNACHDHRAAPHTPLCCCSPCP